jgi:hypothetical protein
VAFNFQTGKNKMQVLTEYESVTQKVLLLSYAASSFILLFPVIGHGNPDRNLESPE